MSDMKCPFCQQELECCGIYIDGTKKLWCDNCGLFGDNRLFEALIYTHKTLEQSETCCTEWEKEALDYKAENIALSGELERTRKALEIAKDTLRWYNDNYDSVVAQETINEITALEQKDVK